MPKKTRSLSIPIPLIFISLGLIGAGVILFFSLSSELKEEIRKAQSLHNSVVSAMQAKGVDGQELIQVPEFKADQTLPSPRPILLDPRFATPNYPITLMFPDFPEKEEEQKEPIIEEKDTPPQEEYVLLAPQALVAEPFPEAMTIVLFWQEGELLDNQKLPQDYGYLLSRAEIDAEGKPGKWKQLFAKPIVATSYQDTTAEAEKNYLYVVAQVSKHKDVEQNAPESMGKYFSSEKTQSIKPVKLSAPQVTWYYTNYIRGDGPEEYHLNARLHKWFLVPISKDLKIWIKVVLEITRLKTGAPLGRTYQLTDILEGSSDAESLAFSYFYYDTKNEKILSLTEDTEKVQDLDITYLLEALQGKRNISLDMGTGLEWLTFNRATNELVFINDDNREVSFSVADKYEPEEAPKLKKPGEPDFASLKSQEQDPEAKTEGEQNENGDNNKEASPVEEESE